jgi:hypothetical protein
VWQKYQHFREARYPVIGADDATGRHKTLALRHIPNDRNILDLRGWVNTRMALEMTLHTVNKVLILTISLNTDARQTKEQNYFFKKVITEK